ncbi:transcription factor bHLH61-like isoform X2 [Coffea arabica]
MNKTSIVVDASNYIEELKQKVERLKEDISSPRSSSDESSSWPKVSVKTLEKGVLVNVYSGKSCPGLLVSILEAFENLGLNVLEARVSCADSFHLQAVGGENEDNEEIIDAQVVKRAVADAIRNWEESDTNEQ